MDDEELETTAYVRYWWDCPACDEVNDNEDIDPQGETLECADCGATVTIKGSM